MQCEQQHIVAYLQGAAFSSAVCDYANWIAKATQRPLTFLHTIEPSIVPATSDLSGAIGLGASEDLLNELTDAEQNHRRLLIKKGNLMLQAAQARAEAQDIDDIHITQQHGNLIETLIDMEDHMRLLVLGVSKESDSDIRFNKQLETIVRALHTPIFMVNQEFSSPKKVMLAYNQSEGAQKALDMIASSRLFKELTCDIVHVEENIAIDTDTMLQKAESQLNQANIKTSVIKLQGEPEVALTSYQIQHHIDLVIMGAFSHNKIRNFFLGSFTEKMLKTMSKPLLLLR